ncbi:MAG: hypothetical protein JSS36_02080 [Proteobacteria bacterium]|nr:hypothetical protein [Pseudomonadota bacterium]
MSESDALITRAGRGKTAPITVTPAGLTVIEELAAAGNDQRTIAKALGMDRKTMTDMRRRIAEVDEAFERGLAALGDELTHLLLSQARGGNVVAAIYLTKARLGWREGDAPESRPNIIINLPDAQTPEAYLRAVRVTGTGVSGPLPALPGGEGLS